MGKCIGIGELSPKAVLVPKKGSRSHAEGGIGKEGGKGDEDEAIGLNMLAKASACGPAHIPSEVAEEDRCREAFLDERDIELGADVWILTQILPFSYGDDSNEISSSPKPSASEFLSTNSSLREDDGVDNGACVVMRPSLSTSRSIVDPLGVHVQSKSFGWKEVKSSEGVPPELADVGYENELCKLLCCVGILSNDGSAHRSTCHKR